MANHGWTRREFLQSVSAMMTLAGTPLGAAERVAETVFEQVHEEIAVGEAFSLMTMRTERQTFPLLDLFVNIEYDHFWDDSRPAQYMYEPGLGEASIDFKALLKDCNPSRLPMTCSEIITVEMYDERLTWEFKGLASSVEVQRHVVQGEPVFGDSLGIYHEEPLYEESVVVAEMVVFGQVTVEERVA